MEFTMIDSGEGSKERKSQHALGLAGLRELIRRRRPPAAAGRPTILFQF
jgi:hypothetical protein